MSDLKKRLEKKFELKKDTERGDGIGWLWFSPKSGWQVTSFHPSTDPAIGFPKDADAKLYVSVKHYEDKLKSEVLPMMLHLHKALGIIREETNDGNAAEIVDEVMSDFNTWLGDK